MVETVGISWRQHLKAIGEDVEEGALSYCPLCLCFLHAAPRALHCRCASVFGAVVFSWFARNTCSVHVHYRFFCLPSASCPKFVASYLMVGLCVGHDPLCPMSGSVSASALACATLSLKLLCNPSALHKGCMQCMRHPCNPYTSLPNEAP
jgi:hypothetical protein